MRIIITDEIHLSECLPSDQAACLHHLGDKQIYDQTLRIPYPYTEADFQAWMKIVGETTQCCGQPVHWAIREAGGNMIGACGFSGVEIGKSHRAELGYWLAKPFWGRGIATAV